MAVFLKKSSKTSDVNSTLIYKICFFPIVMLLWRFNYEPIILCIVLSIIAGLATLIYIPKVESNFKRVGLYGMDLNKMNRPILPEGMGVVAATFYIIATILFIPFIFNKMDYYDGQKLYRFPYNKFSEYLSALLSLQSMVFLGFADDVLNLRWRFKLIFPTVASIPVLMVYYVSFGQTHVIVPKPLHGFLPTRLDLGAFYYIYIGLMAVFCTNSINILAGINGVEVIQSVVISASIIINNSLHIVYGKPETAYYHSLSLVLMLPFICVSLALYKLNKYPAKVFVGDTYCYFAGMTFAVSGILGHFSKTLLLFFMPQILNFVYSTPQLFRLVPCPRHRMPNFTMLNYSQPADSKHVKVTNKSPKNFSIDSTRVSTDTDNSPNTLKKIFQIKQSYSGNKADQFAPSSCNTSEIEINTSSFDITDTEGELSATTKKRLQKVKSNMVNLMKNKKPTKKSMTHSRSVLESPAQLTKPIISKNGFLTASKTSLLGCKPLGLTIIKLLEVFGLVKVWRDQNGKMIEVNNFTLLNFLLIKYGPMPEHLLTRRIMYIQITFSILAFFIRFTMSSIFYDEIFK
ncbi:hypothetical protein BB561_004705 [Smittium simulii]|uniref:UDP-N-acetylglucosamine--dolichyl-phosphate N-acetylglucosaminephosphotransferase n=1 Tax=Smittium simulii TaxID=133385 RepID=A0A2T9YEW8_9FUNG|nr:hypothetical protein BB561_004705 [Smittium simulii]